MPGKVVNISRDGNKVILEAIEESWDQSDIPHPLFPFFLFKKTL